MNPIKQEMTSTDRPLYHREAVIVANLYRELKDWPAVRTRVIEENLLQTRTRSTLKKKYGEISSRLKHLSPALLDLLSNGTYREQRHILWLAVCLRHPFIYAFAVEVVRENFLGLKETVTSRQFDTFFVRKAQWHERLDRLKTPSVTKMKNAIFKMLRVVQILTKQNTIMPVLLSPRLYETIMKDAPEHIAVFPLSETAGGKERIR